MKLQGKIAVVTGGGAGIGRAISLRFAKEGALVAVGDIDAERARKVADEIRAEGGKALAQVFDVSDPLQVAAAFKEVEESLGPVDILVNNAGGAIVAGPIQRSFAETEIEYMRRMIDINLMGKLYCAQAVVSGMIERRSGKIINMSSIRGMAGSKNNILYSVAKGGVIPFTKSLAMHLAEYGITVNTISPGAIDSRPGPASLPNFLGRPGRCDEVAGLALFIASEEGDFITGSNMVIDGGRVLGAPENLKEEK